MIPLLVSGLALAIAIVVQVAAWRSRTRTAELLRRLTAAADSPLDQLTPTNPGTYAAAIGMLTRRARRRRHLQGRAQWN